jgi:hypothetical protein
MQGKKNALPKQRIFQSQHHSVRATPGDQA